MMIEIAQMALSYCLINCEKIVFWNIMDVMVLKALHELAAPSAGQLKAFKWFKAPNASRISAEALLDPVTFYEWRGEFEIASAVIKLPTVVI